MLQFWKRTANSRCVMQHHCNFLSLLLCCRDAFTFTPFAIVYKYRKCMISCAQQLARSKMGSCDYLRFCSSVRKTGNTKHSSLASSTISGLTRDLALCAKAAAKCLYCKIHNEFASSNSHSAQPLRQPHVHPLFLMCPKMFPRIGESQINANPMLQERCCGLTICAQ